MSLTCLSCRVLFAMPDLQREHYKSDWHRYNLKRKVAELPPVTKEEFDIRAAAYSQNVPETATPALTCELCHKKFVSKNSLVNHLQSKKHLEMQKHQKMSSEVKSDGDKSSFKTTEAVKTVDKEHVLEDDEDSDWESCDDDDEEVDVSEDASIPPNACLFCSFESANIEDNVKHMTEEHSFFIPDIEYLKDLEGLLTYLGHKVGNGYMCLWCCRRGKSFRCAKAAQQHMVDKGHCKMLHEGEALISYGRFYDYTSSHPDTSDVNADDEIALELLNSDNYELVLPSGAVIGHRSLAIYYKQNLRPVQLENRRPISGILQHYKKLGWTGTSGETAIRKAKDLSYMRKLQAKHNLKLSVKKNKFQPHYRPQVMF